MSDDKKDRKISQSARQWLTFNIFKVIANDGQFFVGMSKGEPRLYKNNIKNRCGSDSKSALARHMADVSWDGSRVEMIEVFVTRQRSEAVLRTSYWIDILKPELN
jgi:hypothetical protein